MYCCDKCFDSFFLQKHINVHSTHEGNCNLCPEQNRKLIDPAMLVDLFIPILELYCEVNAGNGQKIVNLLKDDWGIFKSKSDAEVQKLLILIFSNPDLKLDNYEKKFTSEVTHTEEDWFKFKEELKHSNRFFPKSFPDHDKLSLILSYLSCELESDSKNFFRARIDSGIKLHPAEKMGSPPSEIATAGRANPFGISYLYVASTIKTAISEIRPHKSEHITIAEFSIKKNLKLIDLRSPKKTISPFGHSGTELELIHSKLSLLIKLGDELSKPVAQDKAPLEYLSSQYLCEFIKSQGYDGVIYTSSLGDGDNYAIFDESRLSIVSTNGYLIDKVDIEFEESDVRQKNGEVTRFFSNRGYGFIESQDFKGSIFFHINNFTDVTANRELIKVGDKLSFDLTIEPKGPNAINIVKQ